MKTRNSTDTLTGVSADGGAALDLDKTSLPQRPEADIRDSEHVRQSLSAVRVDLRPGAFRDALVFCLADRIATSSDATIVLTDRIPDERPPQNVSVILLTDNAKQTVDLHTMQQRGIVGLLDPTSGGLEQLSQAVDMIAAGYVYLDQKTFNFLVESMDRSDRASREHEYGKLSPRELEVAELLAERLSNKEIASKLHIAQTTVKQHVVRAREKLGNLPDRHAVGEWYRALQR